MFYSGQPPIRSSNRINQSDVNSPWTYTNQPSNQQNGNLDGALNTADSFEQLAALAEAQLNSNNLGMYDYSDPSVSTVFHQSQVISTGKFHSFSGFIACTYCIVISPSMWMCFHRIKFLHLFITGRNKYKDDTDSKVYWLPA